MGALAEAEEEASPVAAERGISGGLLTKLFYASYQSTNRTVSGTKNNKNLHNITRNKKREK